MDFFVYILLSEKSGRYYTGQTHDLIKRLLEHNGEDAGHTLKEQPWKIVWYTKLPTRSDAVILERKIKKRGAKRFLDDMSNAQPS
jgi:putative endonuclease